MPNEAQINFQACLSSLEELQNEPEDLVFSTTHKDHLNLLQSLNLCLSNKVQVSPTDADRVLRICLQYITDVRCVLYVFSIISDLIDIDKDNPLVDFLPFGLAILKFLNTKCIDDNTSKLRILSFQLLMKHPKSTLTTLIKHHSPNIVQSIVELNKADDLPSKIESFQILMMLEWLPSYEKKLFVEAGISFWLTGIIPAMMQIVVSAEDVNKIETCLTYTEMLAKELVLLDYHQNPHWKSLLEHIANPKMFPASIMDLLKNGKDNWHRIWIVLIKLLKNQVTRYYIPFTSPINAMLPIVESAFTKESAQRVRAFACWNELIESFCHETGNYLEKRIKLLIIPLKLFNTRTEETTLAKFQTWWQFIHKFRPIIQKFTNEILISFLYFMFGNPQATNQFQANMVSQDLRKKCIEAFAEIMGHVNCSNCAITNLKPLNGNITTTILLTDHWKEFVYALKSCIRSVAQTYTMDMKTEIKCIWLSFVMRLAAMAENTLRQDMFEDLINIVSELILKNKKCRDASLMEILVDDIVLPLWRETKLKTLTKSRSQSHRPMHRIVKLIMDDQFSNYFKRFNSEELSRLLHPLISTLLEESISTPQYIIWLLDELLVTDTSLIMWTALVQASKESNLSLEAFCKILIWPFKTVHVSVENGYSELVRVTKFKYLGHWVTAYLKDNVDIERERRALAVRGNMLIRRFAHCSVDVKVKEAAEAWYTLYNNIHENLEEFGFDNEITKVLTRPVEDSKASNYFVLFALIGVLKHKPDEAKIAKLEALTYEMNDYNDFAQLLTPLVNTIVLMINNSTDENIAQITINCVENILKVIKSKTKAIGSKSPIQNGDNTFSNVRADIPMTNKTMLSDTIISTLKSYLEECPYQYIKKQVRSLLSLYDKTESLKNVSDSPKKVSKSPRKITFSASPKIKDYQKSKNKEASIERTVVENGEEYVVIKSNWKFNPKNLTVNQKEKLQRKRDIPALYQDLSQSQDGFKLTSWKTDSQDTSLSSSRSATTSNDVSDTLNKITNSDIVPKIMENILDVEKNSKPKTVANASTIAKVKTPKADKLPTPGDTKSPRMALKDRVYRNVRNLIENSSPSTQDKVTDKQEDTNILQNVAKSPLYQPEPVCIENPVKNVESNEINLKPSNNDVITTDKQESGSPVTLPPNIKMKKNMVVSTQRIDHMMKLVCTPVSMAQKKIELQFAASQTSVERPARLKKTPKKFDNTLLMVLPAKRRRYGKNDSQSNSQDLLECHTETVTAQVHKPDDKITDPDSPHDVSLNEAETNENAKKSPIATDDVIIVENVTSCASFDDTSDKDTEKASLISSKTSINKPTVKSPEKPSTGEVPSSVSKDSEDVNNDAAHNATYDSDGGAQHDVITDQTDTSNRCRKSNVQKEISANDENAAVNTPVDADKDLNQPKLSAKKSVVLNDTKKNVEMVEVVPTPINKTKKDSDTYLLPLSEPQESQKTFKKVGQDKLTQKKAYNNKDEENLLITPKNQKKKKSRIEKELAIDTVEGHPFLKTQSTKRLTRKKLMEVENGSKRKTLIDKLNKSKLEIPPKTSKKNKKCSPSVNSTIIVEDSQNKTQSVSQQNVMVEPPCSEDVIESSQDSTMTTICVKAKRRTPKRLPVVTLEKITLPITITEDLLQNFQILDKSDKENHENIDLDLPQNMSDDSDTSVIDLTEDMDTEPLGDPKNTTDITENMDTEPLAANETDNVIFHSQTLPTPVTINSESEPVIGRETQELAEADTQPNDPKQFEKWEINKPLLTSPHSNPPESLTIEDNDITQSLPEAALMLANMGDTTKISSPFKDDNQRKEDFLNNTVEISPIKVQSPDRQNKFPSPETNIDFVVIQLSSPVHSDGEPFDKQCSPEFFTEDKVSPDKMNASPPRVDVTVTNSSHSGSLSLKKNRGQVNRPCSGRAAQMLGLLSVSSDIKDNLTPSKEDFRAAFIETFNDCSVEQNEKIPPKKALRGFHRFKDAVNDCSVEQNATTEENFLKLQRLLPSVTSSPSGPILKRKHVEITDDSTASPANKRKRVSFHDPPVSTTVSVQKYIEPISLMRSPQNPAKKRQTRSGGKSPKKLDNAFLDSALSKTVESFIEATTPSDETENISLDVTPAVEIVKTNELNDTDPICPDLIDCSDPIDVIAIELSSNAMRDLFVKELEGKVDTVGDLAKMTELEVNRLCIKAPKITVAKKVLTDYITNRPAVAVETVIEDAFSEPMTESILNESKADVEIQTDEIEVSTKSIQVTVEQVTSAQTQTEVVVSDKVEVSSKSTQVTVEQVTSAQTQTEIVVSDKVEVSSKSTQVSVEQVTSAQTQTELVVSANTSVQTIESGSKTVEEIIDSCMSEKGFFEKFMERLNDDQMQSIAGLLPEKTMWRLYMRNTDASSTTLIHRILKRESKGIPKSSKPSARLKFLREMYLKKKYENDDLGIFGLDIIDPILKPA